MRGERDSARRRVLFAQQGVTMTIDRVVRLCAVIGLFVMARLIEYAGPAGSVGSLGIPVMMVLIALLLRGARFFDAPPRTTSRAIRFIMIGGILATILVISSHPRPETGMLVTGTLAAVLLAAWIIDEWMQSRRNGDGSRCPHCGATLPGRENHPEKA
jgi:hypothetical protein